MRAAGWQTYLVGSDTDNGGGGKELDCDESFGGVKAEELKETVAETAVGRSNVEDEFDELKAFGQGEPIEINTGNPHGNAFLTSEGGQQCDWRAATGHRPVEDYDDDIFQKAERGKAVTESGITP